MNGISDGQEKALRQILLNYANDDNATAWEVISAILSVVGCDTERATLRDQFAMAAMVRMGNRNYMSPTDGFEAMATICYREADAMMEARKK